MLALWISTVFSDECHPVHFLLQILILVFSYFALIKNVEPGLGNQHSEVVSLFVIPLQIFTVSSKQTDILRGDDPAVAL